MSSPSSVRDGRVVYRAGGGHTVNVSPPALRLARRQLSAFVSEQARLSAHKEGFGWRGTAEAPSTYQQLRGAYAHSAATGAPLPISNLYCDHTIFLTPEDNVRFRFWHDTSHVRLGLSFRLDDEWELACWHLDQARRAGFSSASLEYRLLRADTLGQIIIQAVAQRFPLNQGAFVVNCAERGMDVGILDELRRLQ